MHISTCTRRDGREDPQDRDAVYLAVKECGLQRVSGEASAEALQLVQQLLSKAHLGQMGFWLVVWTIGQP